MMDFLHKQCKNAVIGSNINGYVKLLLLFSLVYQAAAQIGKGSPIAIRIACGSSKSSQSPKGNLWLKDFGFTGGKTAKFNGKNELAPQSSSLRYFDMSDGPENCYNVTTQNGHYLLRFFFAYGNVDNADLEPQFDVSIEGTLAYTLNRPGWSNDRSISYAESLVYVEDGAATVCLHSSGHGNPSIASLELLQVYDTAYELEHPWSHHIILKLVKRVNCGWGNSKGYEGGYNGNVWGGDRYWESDEMIEKGITSSVNTTQNIKKVNAAPNFYPEFIYQTASTANTGVSVSYNIEVEPNQNYTLWFHFAEITTAIAAKEQRVIDILVNSRPIFTDVDILALTGEKFTAVTLNKTVFIHGKTLVITFSPVQRSVLVNAFEVYQVIRTEYTTDRKEVWALQALKHSLALPARVGWNGDPCVPQEHPWSGISCGFKEGWFIDGLDLDNQGLKGYIAKDISYLTNLRSINMSGNSLYRQIPPEIGNLTSLSILDLSYNNLNGSIPASFGNLPRLRKLYLNGNRLSGAVPAILLSGPILGASFNFTDNLDLCGIPGLKPCGFTLSVGAKVGIGFGIFFAIAIGALCGFCYWKRRVNIARSHRLTTTRSAAFAKSKSKFTKDLQLSRVHRVDDLDSPYRDQDNGSLI